MSLRFLQRAVVDAVQTGRLLTRSRRHLEDEARRLLFSGFLPPHGRVVLFKSGRSALAAVLSSWRSLHQGAEILVPDYVCNVVPLAVRAAGWRTVAYPTSNVLLPDRHRLSTLLERDAVGGVVLASICGARCTSPDWLAFIRERRRDVLVVLDDCQNLVPQRPMSIDDLSVMLFSFNQKTVSGAMGGGVVVSPSLPGLAAPAAGVAKMIRLELATFLVYVNQVRRRLLGVSRPRRAATPMGRPFEYSLATSLHYDLRPEPITRVSLARAIVGLRTYRCLEEERRVANQMLVELLAGSGIGQVLETDEPETAALVPVTITHDRPPTGAWWRGSYAVDGEPGRSLRPELMLFSSHPGTADEMSIAARDCGARL